MSLTNLRSVFADELEDNVSAFKSNQPGVFDSRFNYNIKDVNVQTFTTGIDINPPILDSVLRGRIYNPIRFTQDFKNDNLFVKPETGEIEKSLFRTETFDPRAPLAKERTLYFNTNKTFTPATNPTDFSTAGVQGAPFTPLNSNLTDTFMDGLSWETLYNGDHTPKNNVNRRGLTPISYGGIVNRDKLNIRDSGTKPSIYNLSRRSLLTTKDNEPYIVSDIAPGPTMHSGGRLNNQGPLLGVPINRMLTDTARIGKFLTSPKGLGFIAAQNFLGNGNSKSVFLSKDGKLKSSKQRFKGGFNPASTLLQTLGRAGFGPAGLVDKDFNVFSLFGANEYGKSGLFGNTPFRQSDTFTEGSSRGLFDFTGFAGSLINKVKNALLTTAGAPITIKEESTGGDRMTLAKIVKGSSIVDSIDLDVKTPIGTVAIPTSPDLAVNVGTDLEQEGMPMYFRDLRTSEYIFFRAYIEGLTENISPSYNPTNYVGRSEPVYVYERAEREISMTLKLVAQTKEELDLIYTKMNKLTSLCYPQYETDSYGNRMKPPLTRFRYGELFGSNNRELLGYIKSISYAIDQSSTYETEVGKRVPRHILATIGYQVIHDGAPNKDTQFYGYVGSNGDSYRD